MVGVVPGEDACLTFNDLEGVGDVRGVEPAGQGDAVDGPAVGEVAGGVGVVVDDVAGAFGTGELDPVVDHEVDPLVGVLGQGVLAVAVGDGGGQDAGVLAGGPEGAGEGGVVVPGESRGVAGVGDDGLGEVGLRGVGEDVPDPHVDLERLVVFRVGDVRAVDRLERQSVSARFGCELHPLGVVVHEDERSGAERQERHDGHAGDRLFPCGC